MAGYASPTSLTVGAGYGKIVTGSKTVTTAGTAVQITTTATPIGGVWLAADMSGGPMAVGDSSVLAANNSQQGVILTPGNQSTFVPINDLSLLWVDAQTSGNKLCYAYVQPTVGTFSA